MRGVGQNNIIVYFEPPVSVLIDDFVLTSVQTQLLDTFDLEQVEVLRGPQGTLFGKNTVGGALNITTVKPQQEAGASVLLRPGNLGTFDSRLSLDIPIDIGWFEDRLFSRIAFSSRNFDGYVDNVLTGQTLSNQNALSFLGSLRLLPTNGVTFDLTGSWSKNQTGGLGPQCRPANPDAPLVSIYPGYLEACAEAERFRFAGNTAQLSTVESYGTWGTLTWDVGDLGIVARLLRHLAVT